MEVGLTYQIYKNQRSTDFNLQEVLNLLDNINKPRVAIINSLHNMTLVFLTRT